MASSSRSRRFPSRKRHLKFSVAVGDTRDYLFNMTEPNQPTEMEEKRKVMFRAFELTVGQLEHDATELTLRAVMHPDLETVKREHMIHTAFMLRETSAWIRKVLLPEKVPANAT